ncbi:acyl carrier protein [Streptomyces sp. NPDC005931]|uniref:acyl carrier protein n=1 Tax=Streptomyces sp. NPDC005931 TaxID=3364737 RepID=UPI0036B485BF
MNVREEVVDVLRGVGFDGGELEDGRHLGRDLDIDSTELVEIVVALEQHFGIDIDAGAEGGFATFGDLVACVARLLPAAAGRG